MAAIQLTLSDDTLWQIVDLLDQGDIVYIQRENGDILSHPDPTRWEGSEYRALIDEVKDLVDAQPDAYFVLEPPEPKEAFYMMEEFVQTVQDEHQKKLLHDALHSKKPFRYFRYTVEDSPLREDWFDYKDAWMKTWVKDRLEGR